MAVQPRPPCPRRRTRFCAVLRYRSGGSTCLAAKDGIQESADRSGQLGRAVSHGQTEARPVGIGDRRMILGTVGERHIALPEMRITIGIPTAENEGKFFAPMGVRRDFLARPNA